MNQAITHCLEVLSLNHTLGRAGRGSALNDQVYAIMLYEKAGKGVLAGFGEGSDRSMSLVEGLC